MTYILIFFCWTWAENDRSLSWMGPVMEALSKSYQKYEMGAGSSRSEEEHHEWMKQSYTISLLDKKWTYTIHQLTYISTDFLFVLVPFSFFFFPNLCKSNQDFDTILFQCWLIVYLFEFFVLTYSTVFIFFSSIRNILFACRDKFMRHTFWFPSSSYPISLVSLQCVLFSPPSYFVHLLSLSVCIFAPQKEDKEEWMITSPIHFPFMIVSSFRQTTNS